MRPQAQGRRRGSARRKTTLYASYKGEDGQDHDGRGGSSRRLEIEHDEWAAAVAHLGLVRGKRGSELTEEERHERRLRDPQASRQGEERARQREEIKHTAEAANAMSEAWSTTQASSNAMQEEAQRTRDASELDRQHAARERHDAAQDRVAAAEARKQAEEREARTRQAEIEAADQRAVLHEQVRIEVTRLRDEAEANIAERNAALAFREKEQTDRKVLNNREAARLDADHRSTLDTERRHVEMQRAEAERMRVAGNEMQKLAAEHIRTAREAGERANTLRRQLVLLGRAVLDDALGLEANDSDERRVRMNERAMDDAERQAYSARWSDLVRHVAATFAAIRDMANSVREQLSAVIARERAVQQREAALASRWTDMQSVAATADQFAEAWSAIPEIDRTPPVRTALQRRSALKEQLAALSKDGSTLPKGMPRSGIDPADRSRSDSERDH